MSLRAIVFLSGVVLLSAGCRKRPPSPEARKEAQQQTRVALERWLDGAPKEEVLQALREAAKSKVEVAMTALACFGEAPRGRKEAPLSDAARQRACVNLAITTQGWLTHPKSLGVLWRGASPGLVELAVLPYREGGGRWWCAQYETRYEDQGRQTRVSKSPSRCALDREGCEDVMRSLGPLGQAYGPCRPMHPDFRNTAECLSWRGNDGHLLPACTVTDCSLLQRQLRAAGVRDISACVLWMGRELPPPSRPID